MPILGSEFTLRNNGSEEALGQCARRDLVLGSGTAQDNRVLHHPLNWYQMKDVRSYPSFPWHAHPNPLVFHERLLALIRKP